jgi:hypothetical protein
MWTLQHPVGRFVELRIESPITIVDLEPLGQRLGQAIAAISGRFVVCTDLSRANIMPPDVAEAFIRLMRRDNPQLERSGFLVGASALFSLQLERMLKEANNPSRRPFRSAAPLVSWLSEVLNPAEQVALKQFLGL